MALSDRKIPIIAGRNDIPTTSELEDNHPNGSFITKKFNDLIDELTPHFGFRQRYVEYYVDGTTGNDITGNGSQTAPFATIQKVIDASILDGYCGDIFIFISGTFENPSIDLTNYTFQSNQLGRITGIYLIGDSTTYATFNFSNLVTNANIEFEGDSNFEFIKSNRPQSFWVDISRVNFNFNDLSTGLFFSNKMISLIDCTFTATSNTRAYALMAFNNCGISMSNCNFQSLPAISVNGTNVMISPIELTNCNLLLDNTSILGLSNATFKYIVAFNNQILIRSDNTNLNGQLITIHGIGNRIEFINSTPQQIIELADFYYIETTLQNKIVGV